MPRRRGFGRGPRGLVGGDSAARTEDTASVFERVFCFPIEWIRQKNAADFARMRVQMNGVQKSAVAARIRNAGKMPARALEAAAKPRASLLKTPAPFAAGRPPSVPGRGSHGRSRLLRLLWQIPSSRSRLLRLLWQIPSSRSRLLRLLWQIHLRLID